MIEFDIFLKSAMNNIPFKKLSGAHVFNIVADLIVLFFMYHITNIVIALKLNKYLSFFYLSAIIILFVYGVYICFVKTSPLDKIVSSSRNKNK
jgi:hypothetical protein